MEIWTQGHSTHSIPTLSPNFFFTSESSHISFNFFFFLRCSFKRTDSSLPSGLCTSNQDLPRKRRTCAHGISQNTVWNLSQTRHQNRSRIIGQRLIVFTVRPSGLGRRYVRACDSLEYAYVLITNHASRLVFRNDPEIKWPPQSMYYA